MIIKRKYRIIVQAVLVVLFSWGCKEDFLETSPTEYISTADFEESKEVYPDLGAGVNRGLYDLMVKVFSGGTENHEDFGQKGYDIITDILSGDVALIKNSFGRYDRLAQLQETVDFTNERPNAMAWFYYYKIINASNMIIQSLGDEGALTNEEKPLLGQALAMRSYAYFYLSQLYIEDYNLDSKVLPIYEAPNSLAKAQSTNQEVYDFMIADLTKAIDLLQGYARSNAYEINQNVARGLLAYVYASMETSEGNLKAKELADQVIESGEFPVTTKEQTIGGFNNVKENPSWMWGMDLTSDYGLALVSWWGQMDYYTFSYQVFGDVKGIDESLYNQIRDADVRKKQFLNDPTQASQHMTGYMKFYHKDREPKGERIVTSDYLFMRVDEMYMLSAEMAAKEGLDFDAVNRLKEVLAHRFDNEADYSYVDGLSGQALIDEIYLQTRIEFWAEGKTYLALKRNDATVVRGDNHEFLSGESIPHDDDRLTLEVPQKEIINNPFINNN